MYKDMYRDIESRSIIGRAVLEISTMKHFYSQDVAICTGALQHAARSLGGKLTESQAEELVPQLREALRLCQAYRRGSE
jgi:hypothetical protein